MGCVCCKAMPPVPSNADWFKCNRAFKGHRCKRSSYLTAGPLQGTCTYIPQALTETCTAGGMCSTSHLLLGLLNAGDGRARQVLEALGADLEALEREVRVALGPAMDPAQQEIEVRGFGIGRASKLDAYLLAKSHKLQCWFWVPLSGSVGASSFRSLEQRIFSLSKFV